MEKIKLLWQRLLAFFKQFLPSYTFELKAEDLEKRMTQVFPVKIKKLIFVFKLSDPEVILLGESIDRIAIGVTLKVSIPGLLAAKGRATVEGEIDYDSEEGSFFFFDPIVKEMNIKGLPGRYNEEVRELFDGIVRSTLGDMCIYKFDQEDKKQKVAKRLLKSVRVEDERLKIQIGF